MRVLSIAILCLSTTVCAAAPVYLDCAAKTEHPPPGVPRDFRFSVKIDEASGAITHNNGDGSAFNAEGFFTAGEVGYKHAEEETDLQEAETSYKIDRTNLSFVRTDTTKLSERGMQRMLSPDEYKRVFVTKGTCKIVDVKNRKF